MWFVFLINLYDRRNVNYVFTLFYLMFYIDYNLKIKISNASINNGHEDDATKIKKSIMEASLYM